MAEQLRSTMSHAFPEVSNQLSFLAQLNRSNIQEIPEQVKNRILDWACKLESAGITGEGHSFTAREKQIAESMVFNLATGAINQSQNVNVGGSFQGGIQVASPHSVQRVSVKSDPKFSEVVKRLREVIANSELDEVDKGEIESDLDRVEELATGEQTEKVKLKINEKLAAIVSMIAISDKVYAIGLPLVESIRTFFHSM